MKSLKWKLIWVVVAGIAAVAVYSLLTAKVHDLDLEAVAAKTRLPPQPNPTFTGMPLLYQSSDWLDSDRLRMVYAYSEDGILSLRNHSITPFHPPILALPKVDAGGSQA